MTLLVGFMVLAKQSLEMNFERVTVQSFSNLFIILYKRFFTKTPVTAPAGTFRGGIYGVCLTIV